MISRFLAPSGHRLSEPEGLLLRAARELSAPQRDRIRYPEPTLYQLSRRAGLPWNAETLAVCSRLIRRGLLRLGESGGVTPVR